MAFFQTFLMAFSLLVLPILSFAASNQKNDLPSKIIENEISQCKSPCRYGTVWIDENSPKAVQLYYTVEGSEKNPPVILLHGGGLNSTMYLPLSQSLLNANFQVWKIDTRGHGLSSNPSSEFSYPLLAEDLYEFIQKKNIHRPILVGYSDGGITALFFVTLFPKVARAIIPIAAAPITRDLTHYMKGIEFYYGNRPTSSSSSEEWLKSLLGSERMNEHYSSRHLDGIKLLEAAWKTWIDPLSLTVAQLGKVQLPVHYILADRDEFFTPEDGKAISEATPGSQLILVEGTHIFFKQNPALFEGTVLSSLRKILNQNIH